jgi:hypothetical protein
MLLGGGALDRLPQLAGQSNVDHVVGALLQISHDANLSDNASRRNAPFAQRSKHAIFGSSDMVIFPEKFLAEIQTDLGVSPA